MPAGLILCRVCRKPRRSSPCDGCKAKARPDLRDPHEIARRERAIAEHVRVRGLLCPGWGVPPHFVMSRRELTAEHGEPVAAGGAAGQRLLVLCRPCNGRHGAATARKGI